MGVVNLVILIIMDLLTVLLYFILQIYFIQSEKIVDPNNKRESNLKEKNTIKNILFLPYRK